MLKRLSETIMIIGMSFLVGSVITFGGAVILKCRKYSLFSSEDYSKSQ